MKLVWSRVVPIALISPVENTIAESLLTAAADPFIAGLASTVVEAATIDGAKVR